MTEKVDIVEKIKLAQKICEQSNGMSHCKNCGLVFPWILKLFKKEIREVIREFGELKATDDTVAQVMKFRELRSKLYKKYEL